MRPVAPAACVAERALGRKQRTDAGCSDGSRPGRWELQELFQSNIDEICEEIHLSPQNIGDQIHLLSIVKQINLGNTPTFVFQLSCNLTSSEVSQIYHSNRKKEEKEEAEEILFVNKQNLKDALLSAYPDPLRKNYKNHNNQPQNIEDIFADSTWINLAFNVSLEGRREKVQSCFSPSLLNENDQSESIALDKVERTVDEGGKERNTMEYSLTSACKGAILSLFRPSFLS